MKFDLPADWLSLGERLTGIRADELEQLIREKRWDAIPQSDYVPRDDREERAKRREVLLEQRWIPLEHVMRVYDRQPVECNALTAVEDFFRHSERLVLVLKGSVGVGKSGSAAWALTRIGGKFVSAQRVVDISLQNTDEGKERWVSLAKIQFLVLDDLGRERVDSKGFGSSMIGGLLETRYDTHGRTIITTNLTPAEIGERYGVRVLDRLQQHWTWVECTGPSLRVQS